MSHRTFWYGHTYRIEHFDMGTHIASNISIWAHARKYFNANICHPGKYFILLVLNIASNIPILAHISHRFFQYGHTCTKISISPTPTYTTLAYIWHTSTLTMLDIALVTSIYRTIRFSICHWYWRRFALHSLASIPLEAMFKADITKTFPVINASSSIILVRYPPYYRSPSPT